jgi:hypothetical protein
MEVAQTGMFDLQLESEKVRARLTEIDEILRNTHKQLEKIYLNKKITRLADVVVIAPQNLIETKIDKMVFNAEKDLTSQGGVATDVLKKIPMVSVDVDGNVERRQLASGS